MVVCKIVTVVEEIHLEGGRAVTPAARVVVVAAVVRNPWAGQGFVDDLGPGIDATASDLGELLAPLVLDALGAPAEAYGKAAIVGLDGEIEHGGALIHTPWFGNLMRDFLQGESIICFADVRGDAGETLVVPMWHKTAAATRSHYQTISARVSDAPRPGEIVVLAAASSGPRPHARIGDRTTDPTVSAENLEREPSW